MPYWLKALMWISSSFHRNVYFVEQYSTILSQIPWFNGKSHPECWKWHNGRLTNSNDGEKEFMYLHFMNWKSAKWLASNGSVQKAAWEYLNTVVPEKIPEKFDTFYISRDGFGFSNQKGYKCQF